MLKISNLTKSYDGVVALDDISLKYPGLKPQINRGVSLAINGKIYRESWFIPIDDDSEVVLMPYMQGG